MTWYILAPQTIEVYEKHTQTILGGDEIASDHEPDAEESMTSLPEQVFHPHS